MAKKKAPPKPPPTAKKKQQPLPAVKAKRSTAGKKRAPSVSRGGCSTAQMKYGRSYKAADQICEADAADHTAFGQAGGNARAAAAKPKKVVRVGPRVFKV